MVMKKKKGSAKAQATKPLDVISVILPITEETLKGKAQPIKEEPKPAIVPAKIYLRGSLEEVKTSLKDLCFITPIHPSTIEIDHLKGLCFIVTCANYGEILIPLSELDVAVAELASLETSQLVARELFYLTHTHQEANKPEWLINVEKSL